MQFNITKIEIENFRSIQDKVTLNVKSGLFSIEGINYTEINSTNGSGKSTLISALFWALTGSSLTNEVLADEVVNLKTNKNCRVSVYITTDKDEIKITRVRKDTDAGNNLFLEINGQDLSCHKVADTQDRINKLIKIPFDLLRNTIIMTSGMDSAFSSLTPQQRIQTLESIRDYSVWERIRDEANKDSKEYNNQITKNTLEISNLTGSINTYKKLAADLRSEQMNSQYNSNIEHFDVLIENNKKEKDKYEEQVITKKAEIDNFDNSTIDTTEVVTKMSAITDEVNAIKLKVQQEKNNIDRKLQAIDYDLKDVNRELDVIDRWFKDDTCPTCGKKLDRTETEIAEKNIQKNTFINKKLQLFKDKEAISTESISNLETEAENKIAEKRIEYKTLQDELEKAKALQQEKSSKFNALQGELTTLQRKITDIELTNKELAGKKEAYQAKIVKCEEDIKKYDNEVIELENKVKALDDSNKELEGKKKLSDFYYKLLGAKGELRPYLLNKDIAYLNNRMQFYIGRFFKNTEVSLLLNGASIDIKIQADGVTKSISSLSGGEKKRVDISIQLALYDLIQTVSQSRFNLLCLDEIESLLDPIGCEQLIEIIEDKAENIETVWWITNHPSVKESIPQKILVKKILGKTEVEEI